MAFEKLLHYRSTTPTAVPAAADMDGGQLAMNLADERIFIKNAAGSVVEPNPRAHTHPLDQITNATDIFKSIAIPSGADLNDYTTPGLFHQPNNAGASGGTNYPAPAAGNLLVYTYSSGATAQFAYQIYITYNGTGVYSDRMFWRTYYYNTTPNAWTAWNEVLSNEQKGVANGIATLDADGQIPASQHLPNVVSTSSSSISISTIKSNTYTRLTNGAVPVTISVPASAAQSGDEFHFRQSGTAEVLFSAGSGVTINAPFGGTLTLAGPGATVTLKCIGTDLYDLMGQVLAA